MRRKNRREQIENVQFHHADIDLLKNFADGLQRRIFFQRHADNFILLGAFDDCVVKFFDEIFLVVIRVVKSVSQNPIKRTLEKFIEREHVGGKFFFGRRQIQFAFIDDFQFSFRGDGNNQIVFCFGSFDDLKSFFHVNVINQFFVAENFHDVRKERTEKRSQPLLSVENQSLRVAVNFFCAFNRSARKF